jgi:hypothetical protein
MSIFFMNETRIFIHYRYLAQDGNQPSDSHPALPAEVQEKACAYLAVLELQTRGYSGNAADHAEFGGARKEILPCWTSIKRFA